MELNPVALEILTHRYSTKPDGTRVPSKDNSVQSKVAAQIHQRVTEARPHTTLEIGVNHGVSTITFCQALETVGGPSMHHAIDSGDLSELGVQNVKRAGLAHRLTFHKGPSQQVLPRLLDEGLQPQVVFIDGSHLFDLALVDFYYVDRLLPVGGILGFDDLWLPGVRKVVSFVLRNRSYQPLPADARFRDSIALTWMRCGRRLLQDPFSPGLRLKLWPCNAVFLRKTAHDSRRWDHHRFF